jgi:hypothetical protein
MSGGGDLGVLDQDLYDRSLNTFFEQNSYGSMAILNNLGSTALFITLFAVLHFFAILLTSLAKYCSS